jgi:cell division protein FtsL
VIPVRRTTFGLIERLLYGASIAFLVVVAVEAVRVLG